MDSGTPVGGNSNCKMILPRIAGIRQYRTAEIKLTVGTTISDQKLSKAADIEIPEVVRHDEENVGRLRRENGERRAGGEDRGGQEACNHGVEFLDAPNPKTVLQASPHVPV